MRKMNHLALTAVAICSVALSLALGQSGNPRASNTESGAASDHGMPLWAFGYKSLPPPAGAAAAPAPAQPTAPEVARTLPGSTRSFTRSQIYSRFSPADWLPNAHPPMPEIVAKGREAANIWACSFCHLQHGRGRPENSPVSGVSVSYFVQTMMDYKNGNRKSSDSRKRNANLMVGFAKAMTDAEIRTAAEYFASIPWQPLWVKVKETNTVPKTHVENGLFIPNEGAETEPIGERIIEVPENEDLSENLRDPRSGFIAYVPVGSIKKGEWLVTTGGAGKTVRCGVCHGPDLKGLGPVPAIAGRSPSYLVRQIYDMQVDARKGEWTPLMRPVVEKLNEDDLVAIGAYVASIQ
jgi:cytochrome c553